MIILLLLLVALIVALIKAVIVYHDLLCYNKKI